MRTNYRSDIQGLRGLAIALVVLFHAELPLPGGFLGVDVFFVVSGYVVGSSLVREFESTGNIRIWNFFRRRFLRLFPALVVMVFTVLLIVLVFLWGDVYSTVPVMAIAAMLSLANVALPLVSGDYFAPDAKLNPLLHTWSLSVEEQFYIFLIVFLSLCIWLSRKLRSPFPSVVLRGLAVVALFSFVIALLGSSEYRAVLPFGQELVGFYSPLPRLWQISAGVFLAVAKIPHGAGRATSRFAGLAGLAGILLILGSAVFLNPSMNHPGIATLLPVLGAALLIAAGREKALSILCARPLVSLGNISYSLYLWHWPLVIFAKDLFPGEAWAPIAACVVAIPIASWSYRKIENRFRYIAVGSAKKSEKVKLVAVPLVVVLLAGSVSYVAATGAEVRLLPGNSLEGPTTDADFLYANQEITSCTNPFHPRAADPEARPHQCMTTYANQPRQILLLGDSHAAHYFVGLAEHFNNHGVTYWHVVPEDLGRPAVIQQGLDLDKARTQFDAIILSFRWQGYAPDLMLNQINPALRASVNHGETVLLLRGGPTFPFDVKHCQHGHGIFSLFPVCEESQMSFNPEFATIDSQIASAVGNLSEKVWTIPTQLTFCDLGKCSMRQGNRILFQDQHHLNTYGSRVAADSIGPLVEKYLGD